MSKPKSYIPVTIDPHASDAHSGDVEKCSRCTGTICCTYTTQAVPTPRGRDDFQHLLWQLAHENIQAYKDEDGWFLLINNRCRFLGKDGRCGIYHSRPDVCREYSNDYCELDERAEDNFELFFDGYESLLAYCRKRYKNWDQK